MKGNWVEPEVRDQVVDFVGYWSGRAELTVSRLVSWLGISQSKYYQWQGRYGQTNGHNGAMPRHFWLTAGEQAAILAYQMAIPTRGIAAWLI